MEGISEGVRPFEQVTLNAGAATAFLQSWFAGCRGHVGFVAIPSVGRGVLGQSAPLEEGLSLGTSDLEALVYAGREGVLYNAYVNVGTLYEPIKDVRHRGGRTTIQDVPGVWVDLDVKEGSFADAEAIYAFVRGLALRPTLAVLSGSGGVHCYWKLAEPISPQQAETAARVWWAYLSSMADGRSVDRLVDSTRVMKLPGTVRWPKGGEDFGPRPVELMYADGPVHTLAEVLSLGSEAWRGHQQKLDAVRSRVAEQRVQAGEALQDLGRWGALLAVASIEEEFNAETTWDEVLQPHGWTWVTEYDGTQREDSEGRRQWSRPGGDGSKSATTDWHDSPDVMSLLSDSEGTGLADLKDAGVALSKYRVWLRLAWGDDEAGLVRAWVARGSEAQPEGM